MPARALSRRVVLGGAVASSTALVFGARADGVPRVHDIAIKRFAYEPARIQARVGDTIRWTNLDIVPHTASADDLSWDTGELTRDQSAEIFVEDGMEATYFCVFHPHMTGVIEIV